MNRNIKFRGKRIDNGEWVYGSLLPYANGECNIITETGHRIDTWNIAPDTVGQFIGLLDKNGEEIYEGDIVLCRGKYLYEVQWINDGFALRGKMYGGITSIKSFFLIGREVIGNIHDNPELLKGEPQ